jgi:DNA-binding winged helix-turn-helix (wHTH) protein
MPAFREEPGSPTTVSRSRYDEWLDAHADTPLRLVVAPAGSGKTTATRAWAEQQPGGVGWVTVPAGSDARVISERIAAALQFAEESRPQRATAKRSTVVIDDLENADESGRAFLANLCTFAPDAVTLVYLVRSRAALDVRLPESRGLVAAAPLGRLLFGADEIALFAESLGVRWTPLDCARLCRATGGWAVAVTGAVRAARDRGVPLIEAYPGWFAAEKSAVAALVESAIDRSTWADGQTLRRVFDAPEEPAIADLVALEHAGLFVDRLGDSLRPNPVVAAALGATWATGLTPDEIAPALLDMFGRFRMVVNDREVRFARRREAQIVQFLALQPNGRATRAELLDAFWKDGDRQLAAQGLRTALSAIRGAIARCAGADGVERYFVTAGDTVGLRFEAVISSAHRFESHVNLATAAEARDEAVLANTHWSAASKIYAAPLLAGEPSAAWIEPMAAEYAVLADAARSRASRRYPFGHVVSFNGPAQAQPVVLGGR